MRDMHGSSASAAELSELQTEAQEAPNLRALLESILQAQAKVERVPHHRLEAWSRDRADATATLIERLRERSVRATLDSDWVKMGDFYYLQDKGCQRAAAPWGITFAKLNPHEDIVREEGANGHVSFLVSAMGECSQLGIQRADIGSRSTSSPFWIDEWEAPGCSDTRRDQIISDVRKAAVANAYGRIVRGLTGLNQLDGETLQRYGRDPQRAASAQFQRGAKGGSRGAKAGPASKAQLDFTYRLAFQNKKCSDLPDKDTVAATFKKAHSEGTALKTKVSEWINQAKDADPGFMEWSVFVADVLGVRNGHNEDPMRDEEPGGGEA